MLEIGTMTQQIEAEPTLGLRRKPMLIAGWLAAFTATLHLFGGTPTLRPMLDAAIKEDLQLLLYACWHGISLVLAFSAAAFLVAARSGTATRHHSMIMMTSILWVAFGVVFIGVALLMSGPRMLLTLSQWSLLLPVGALGLYGASAGPRPLVGA